MLYELLIVANTKDGEGVFGKVEKIVKDADSSGVKTTKLGKKNLAYPIAKQTEAEYFVVNFEAEGEAVGKITTKLRLEQESILRYLLSKTKTLKVSKGTWGAVVTEPEEPKKVTVKAVVSPEGIKAPKELKKISSKKEEKRLKVVKPKTDSKAKKSGKAKK